MFAEGAFDLNKVNEALTHHHDDVTRILEEQKAQADTDFAARIRQSRESIENSRRVYKYVGGKPLIITPIAVDTAATIWVSPLEVSMEPHREAFNNWAKFLYGDNVDTAFKTVSISFYFAWKNDSNYYAVINAKTDLISQGNCTARAVPGTIFGGAVSLSLNASLTVHIGATTINYYGSQTASVASLYASTWGDIVGGDSQTKTQYVDRTSSLSCPNILVKDGEWVLFQVSLTSTYWIDGGSVLLNFEGDYHVNCPVLTVELLTSPTATGNLSAINPTIHP